MNVVLFVLSLWLPSTPIERHMLLGLTLGIHLGKSRVCAYILLGFGILETIVMVLVQPYGCMTGLAMVLVGVIAVKLFSKVHQEYASLKTNG